MSDKVHVIGVFSGRDTTVSDGLDYEGLAGISRKVCAIVRDGEGVAR